MKIKKCLQLCKNLWFLKCNRTELNYKNDAFYFIAYLNKYMQ